MNRLALFLPFNDQFLIHYELYLILVLFPLFSYIQMVHCTTNKYNKYYTKNASKALVLNYNLHPYLSITSPPQ